MWVDGCVCVGGCGPHCHLSLLVSAPAVLCTPLRLNQCAAPACRKSPRACLSPCVVPARAPASCMPAILPAHSKVRMPEPALRSVPVRSRPPRAPHPVLSVCAHHPSRNPHPVLSVCAHPSRNPQQLPCLTGCAHRPCAAFVSVRAFASHLPCPLYYATLLGCRPRDRGRCQGALNQRAAGWASATRPLPHSRSVCVGRRGGGVRGG